MNGSRELLTAGRHVLGLARSDTKAEALARLGIEAHSGDLSDTESLVAGAIDNPTSSALTRNALGWSPKESSLLADMRESGYFS